MNFTTLIVRDLNKLKVRKMSNFNFSKRSVERMQGVHPDLIVIFTEAIKTCPIDFGVPEFGGMRTKGEQNLLFKKGLSKCDGFDKISKHQLEYDDPYVNALDFYAYISGKASWDKVHLAIVASTILSTATRLLKEGLIKIKIKWGATFGSSIFKGWDYPHIEIVV